MPDSRFVVKLGERLSPFNVWANVAYQAGVAPLRLTPWYHAKSTLPGAPTTMCGNTFPAPPPAATVTGRDHFDRSGGATRYRIGRGKSRVVQLAVSSIGSAKSVRLTSIEKGRFGAKTTIRTVQVRRAHRAAG